MTTRTFLLAAWLGLPIVATASEAPGIKDGDHIVRGLAGQVQAISTEALRQEIETNPELVLIDIRMPGEVERMGGAIKAPQNVNIPRGWLEFRVTRHAERPDTPIVVYCGADFRSPLAADTLQRMGYTDVRYYPDGFLGWREQGLPVE